MVQRKAEHGSGCPSSTKSPEVKASLGLSCLGRLNAQGLGPDSGPTAPPSVLEEHMSPHSMELSAGQNPEHLLRAR